jgi:5-deoxy-5-amino-3-dehydroquinate synthase
MSQLDSHLVLLGDADRRTDELAEALGRLLRRPVRALDSELSATPSPDALERLAALPPAIWQASLAWADARALDALGGARCRVLSRAARSQLGTQQLDDDGSMPIDKLAIKAVELLAVGVAVELGERSYGVEIGPGVNALLPVRLPPGVRRAAIVTQAGIPLEVDPGVEFEVFRLGEGEEHKTLSSVEELCRGFSRFGLTRKDVVIGVGGGIVTDVAGFAASCYHRGLAVVQVSTTLLGQIDAAVGGKTGVNIPEGKNLIGAFWQPSAVLCDTSALDTLPEREWRCGTGEMAKYAFLGVEGLEQLPLIEQIRACVALKAEVVAADEREGDRRMLLNYGHTLAHALEAAGFADGPGRGGIDLRHGEAVAIGLVFAARLARRLGRIDEARVARHLEVVRAYGLETEVPAGVDPEEILLLMGRDKKATDGLTFVLDGPSGVEVLHDVAPAEVLAELRSACAMVAG